MNLGARRNVVKKFDSFFCATHLLKNNTASNMGFDDKKEIIVKPGYLGFYT